MRIEKRYIDSFKPGQPNPPVDDVFRSLDDLRNYYLQRGEDEAWVDFFINQLKKQGKATDRFAEYRYLPDEPAVKEGDTVEILPHIFNTK